MMKLHGCGSLTVDMFAPIIPALAVKRQIIGINLLGIALAVPGKNSDRLPGHLHPGAIKS